MENTNKTPDPIKVEIAGIYANLAKQNPNFKDRPQQKKLINVIAKVVAMEDRASLVAEAPTGVGKSLSLLMATIPYVKAAGQKLVIATATTALQDQLVVKDIPTLMNAYEKEISFVAIKGRSRYVCPRNLNASLSTEDSAADDKASEADVFERATFKFKPTEADKAAISKLSELLEEHQWDGDRDTLKIPVTNNAWSAVSTDSNSCHRKKCAHYQNCPYYVKKRLIEKSDIIVTNQDFLLSDMQLGGGVILPSYDNSVVVIDEGHHFPSKAIEASAGRYTIKMHANLLGKGEALISRLRSVLMSFSYDTGPIVDLSIELSEHVNMTHGVFEAIYNQGQKSDIEFVMFSKPDRAILPLLDNICTIASDLAQKLGSLKADLEKFIKERELGSDQTDKIIADISQFQSYVTTTLSTYSVFSEDDPVGAPPYAKWIEKSQKGNDVILNQSSIDASQFIKGSLLDQAHKTIFLSATITNLGTFDAFVNATAMHTQNYYTAVIDSPFDYTKSTIYLPDIKSNSNDTENHALEVAGIINLEPLEAPEGVLAIFTSRKKMNAVLKHIDARVKPYLLVQDGTLSKNAMIEKHKSSIDASRPSIIFGLTSFSEGVDLPQEYCTHVLLDKLPFAPVNNPILIKMTEYVESRGLDPFTEISLPEAFVKLSQIVGRLIRSESDTGKITIADNRTRTKAYAKRMIKSLPPFTIKQ